jgi:GH35 family endo-1,4-beta-xylanase
VKRFAVSNSARRSDCPRISAALTLAVVVLLAVPLAARAADDDAVLSGANQRIEKHRMADATIEVVDADGRPLAGAVVVVQQTRHAFRFGSNIFRWGQQSTPEAIEAYKQRYKDLLNFATLPFYWPSYEPRQDQPQHESRMAVARWCLANGITCKGHPLAWNYFEPRWLPEKASEVMPLQLARIEDCVEHFQGTIDIWDVVNEATHFDREQLAGRAPKLTKTWSEIGQIEFARRCFQAARRANPNATLLINDYRTDAGYERVIEGLVDDAGNRLYDVIGIQSHMHHGEWTSQQLWERCERFQRFGVPLHFTELTVLSGRHGWQETGPRADWPSTPEGEAKQAEHVERIYTILFSHPAVEAITWWDFSDDGAWQGAPAGLLRKDLSPKPAYETLHRLIKDQWWTNVEATTDVQGKATVRGFHGDYHVVVRSADGKRAEIALRLVPGENQFLVRMTADE